MVATAQQKRDWRARNPGYQAEWRRNNPEKARAAQARYYARHREKALAANDRYYETLAGRASHLLKSAKVRGKQTTLTREWVETGLRAGCALTGLPFDLSRGPTTPMSPSIDRIDSTKGYTPENCRVICWALNAAFNKWGEDQFQPIAEAWLRRRTQSNA